MMERRMVLGGLAVVLGGVAGEARAQSTPAPATGLPPAPAMKMDMPMRGLTDAVKAHVQDTMAVGGLSLALSRIAAKKLKHPMTRQFADFEVAEQETIADILKARMMPGAHPSGEVTPPTDTAVQDALDPKDRDTVESFRAMKEGPEFEKSYVKAQIDGHKKLLGIQETYLKVADDPDETNVAKLARGMIKEHLALLGDIEKHLG